MIAEYGLGGFSSDRVIGSLRWHYPDRFNGYDLSPPIGEHPGTRKYVALRRSGQARYAGCSKVHRLSGTTWSGVAIDRGHPDGLGYASRPSGVLGSGRKLLDRATQKAAPGGLHPRDKNPEAEKSIA